MVMPVDALLCGVGGRAVSEAGRAATRPDLEAIRKRAEAADKPPWSEEAIRLLLRFGRKQSGPWDDVEAEPIEWLPSTPADAAFIAAAREDVPALVAYCEALEAENAGLKDTLQMEFEEGGEVAADRDARIEALEAALRDVLALYEPVQWPARTPGEMESENERIAAARALVEGS